MNLNLTTNSIGFYQISKLSCIPITLLLETLLNTRQQSLNIMLTTSLLLIVLGMSMILINDISLNKIGLFWAACAVLSTSAGQVLFGPLQKQLGINSIQLLFHTSPILTIASYALIPVFDDVSSLLRTDVTSDLVINIILSCILASLLNMSNYFILSVTSPLTYQIIGHCKTILIIIGGIVLFDEYPSTKVLIGTCVVIVGVILYTEENRKQQLHKLSSLVKHLKQVSNEERHKKHNYFPLFITIPHHLMLSKSIDNCDSNDNDDDTKSMTTVSSASSLFHRSTDTFDSMESGEDQV
jgi:solute carrier family 35 protein E3